MSQLEQYFSMLVKPSLSEMKMSDNFQCLVIVASERLLTSSGNIILVMQRLCIVCSGTETTIQLVSLSRNVDFDGLDMSYECRPWEFDIVHYLPMLGLIGYFMTWCWGMKGSFTGLASVSLSWLLLRVLEMFRHSGLRH